jgi:hypothetical protein
MKCTKSNGFTLNRCNGCGQDISGELVSYSNNVFTGMIYGIAKCKIFLFWRRTEENDASRGQ